MHALLYSDAGVFFSPLGMQDVICSCAFCLRYHLCQLEDVLPSFLLGCGVQYDLVLGSAQTKWLYTVQSCQIELVTQQNGVRYLSLSAISF